MKQSRIVDGRQMQPPEPFEKTMEALDDLPDGEELVLLLYRDPQPLYRALGLSGYRHETALLADGTREIRIWRLAGSAP